MTETTEELAQDSRDANVAPIKEEFILPKEDHELPAEVQALPKRERRGMNKTRRKDMKHAETRIRAAAVRLCPSVIQPVACKFGEKCNCEHDISSFLEKKPADISSECPLYDARGTCPFSYACRFGSAHLDENGKQSEKTPEKPYEATTNCHSMKIQVALRKHEYDFGKSEKALEAIKNETIGAMWQEPKPKLDMKKLDGKKYLAPLTTVGNLPFRRICVDYGADITCGEMALATSILSGAASEYSLLKRHPSEKIFGVQLAGGFADTMSKAAQIVVENFDVDFVDINMGCPIDVVNQKGGGCALPSRPNKLYEVLSATKSVLGDCPMTVKIRTGQKEGILKAPETVEFMKKNPWHLPDLITFHPRSKEQRYTKLANWDYCTPVFEAAKPVPLWVCGDVLSWEDYYERLENYPVNGIMIGRGALIKPWIFTEIDERRTWDITATERFDLLKTFVGYGLDHWGSDDAGVERTRRFLLEFLSFQCRYIPVGILERLPQKINDRPPRYQGRNELETLLSSQKADDWIEISKRLLGPTPEGFTFIPKHKASSY
uniref:tRNA-dihydrouridine(47) synthase [NAD(P)(+)] n=1 Tax=Caenorhabditis tropicalis TaxID=1561998 RepID=A0A1I7UH73_9PELO